MNRRRSSYFTKNKHNAFILIEDILMIAVGIALAIFFDRSGLLDAIISATKGYYIFASFFAGMFFTSAFTLAPSSIALIHISDNAPMIPIVISGAAGAMVGDLILLLFIRDRFADDLKKVIKPKTWRYILRSLHFGFMKWLSPLIGAAIIASPLPDEFGITLLGMSKMRLSLFLPIAFIMNAIGLYLLISFANLL